MFTRKEKVKSWMGRLITYLDGHRGYVGSLALSPDGARLYSGSEDKTIRVWDTKTLWRVAILRGHQREVECLTVAPDGRIISGSRDFTIRIWDPTRFEETAILKGHTAPVEALILSTDGKLYSGSEDNTIRRWNLATLNSEAILQEKQLNSASILRLSPHQQKWLYSTVDYDDRKIKVWERDSLAPRALLEGHKFQIRGLCITPTQIFSASNDRTIRVWDPESFKQVAIQEFEEDLSALEISPDGTYFFAGSKNGKIYVIEAKTLRTVEVLQGHQGIVMALTISPDGKRLYSGSNDESIGAWEIVY